MRRINPLKYQNEIIEITREAYSSWPKKYRPIVNNDKLRREMINWTENIVYGGFDKENKNMRAYSYLREYPYHLEFSVLRACPDSERQGINAAMVAKIIEDYNEKLSPNFYINDGSRSIRHETAFQDYLEKYFNFRKAYCKLNICYRFPIGLIVKILYPFRNIINNNCKIGSLIFSVLKMEEISRTD